MAFEGLSEKLKNIGKKSPTGEGSAPASGEKKPSFISEFFRKNPFVKYLIPVVVFAIAVAVFLYLVLGDGILSDDGEITEPSNSTVTETAVVAPNNEVVPDTTDAALAALIERDPLSEDILVNAQYIGYTMGSSGLKVAIVSNGGTFYQLRLGDTLGASQWVVSEITEDHIAFSTSQGTKILKITA